MKIDSQQLLIIAAVVAGIAVVDKATRTVEAVADINQGTPFENTGVIGTLGNVTNQASGGLFARIGSAIGGAAADIRERVLGIGI